MVLKGRLKLIYDMIPTCDILSDIGTDHALLPAYALLNQRCKKAIACDISPGPLERAERTLKKYLLENRMELRLGSGLEPVGEQEADVIVMAGMGGILITRLIQDSITKAQKANYILLQPMTDQELIRPFLWEQGFDIKDERLVREGDKLYQVIMVFYSGKIRKDWGTLNEIIGEKLIENNDPLLKDWLKDRIKKQKRVVSGLKTAKAGTDSSHISHAEKLLNDLLNLLISIGG